MAGSGVSRAAVTERLYHACSAFEPAAVSRLLRAMRPGRFHLAKYAQEIPAPDLGDIHLGIPPAHELPRHIDRLTLIIKPNDARTMIEIRTDSNMIYPKTLHDVVDVIEVVVQGRFGHQITELLHERFQPLRRKCVNPFFSSHRPMPGRGWQAKLLAQHSRLGVEVGG